MTAAALRSTPDALFVRAQAAERSGDFAAMRAIAERAAQEFPSHPGAWLMFGVACYRAGNSGAYRRPSVAPRALETHVENRNAMINKFQTSVGDL